jgi:L-alanine-DL-glutamate epimerase-like enolase superfamily enzyme
MKRKLEMNVQQWAMTRPVRVTGHVMTAMPVVVATVTVERLQGRGEGSPIYYRGDTTDSMVAEIEAVRGLVESGLSREELRLAMPAGGARNALDCALWDLEARLAGRPVWTLLRHDGQPRALVSTFTLGADRPEAMAKVATTAYRDARALKLKLLGDGLDGARVAAVRAARPDVWLGVDANQGWTLDVLGDMLPLLLAAGVALVEQPLPVGHDGALRGWASPIPLAADESVQTLADVESLAGRYQVVNIKLDKCGGLTEALMMAQAARRLGLQVMVGNMGGTSLGMAPAMVVGQLADYVDLDAPLFLVRDRRPGLVYQQGMVMAPADVWGGLIC